MIVMDLKIDNFCAFNNFHMNMSYPKKIVNSSIEEEHLKGLPNFRYKKANILMGSNATGKTSLGKILMLTFNCISRKEFSKLADKVADKSKTAKISIEFVPNGVELYRVDIEIKISESVNISDTECRMVKIGKNDNYETAAMKLDEKPVHISISDIPKLGWYFTYPHEDNYFKDTGVYESDDNNYISILKSIFKTMDNSIEDVFKLEDVENAYAIVMGKKRLIIQEGKVVDTDMLSSGTRAGIDIAGIIYSILNHENGFYYCDEKFSYIHSDIEKELLALMISNIGENEQLFFTSHNLDILDMDLPKHSFNFMKKEFFEDGVNISCVQASDYLKKAGESLRNAVENDIFSIAPDLRYLNDIEKILHK